MTTKPSFHSFLILCFSSVDQLGPFVDFFEAACLCTASSIAKCSVVLSRNGNRDEVIIFSQPKKQKNKTTERLKEKYL